MVAKKKSFILFLVLFVMLFSVGCLGNSKVYGYYARGTILTADDVKAIMNKIGMPVPSNTRVNNYRDTINGLINSLYSTYNDFTLENMVFYYYNNSLYVVLQNGSVGNTFDYLCIHYNNGNTTIGRYISSGYSGDQIVWFTMDQLQTFYKITETSYSTDTYTYPSFSYTTVPFESGDTTINISQVAPLWNYDACASFIGVGGTGIPNESCAWRVLGNSVQLSGWVAPTSTPTPTPTSTPSPLPSVANTDLTQTNNKIDKVDQSIQEVKEEISGDTQKIIDQLSGDKQEIIESFTDVPDLSGETVTSGDIISSLNINFSGDPYTPFWLRLTTDVSNFITHDVRTVTFTFLGNQHTIDLDDTIPHYPEAIQLLLSSLMTSLFVFIMVKMVTHVVHQLESGDMDEVLEMNEESGIVDLF